jgi:serine/threonine protein kinase
MTTLVDYIWKELLALGFSGNVHTFSELISWIRHVKFIHVSPLLYYKGIKDDINHSLVYQSLKYSDIRVAMNGTFGLVYLVYREKNMDAGYVFLKTSPTHPNALFLEGIFQSIAYSILSYYNFPYAIPRVLDIVRHPDHGIVLAIERKPGAQIFSDYLKLNLKWGHPNKINDTLFLSVLAQIATYLAILEHEIGMNHRDLTGTNVLMVVPGSPVQQNVQLDKIRWSLYSKNQAILIDFGFTCIGDRSGAILASAGEYLPEIDFCPKKGRDLFLFLASVWNVEAFRSSLTDPVKQLFYTWLRDKTSTNWAQWLITSAKTNLTSMYLLTNAGHFESPSCTPLQILRNISEFDSSIVTFA